MNKIIFITSFIFALLSAFAQDDLKCYTDDSITGLFSSNKITGVAITAESEKSITLSVDVEGFDEEGETFMLKGVMLNRKNDTKPVKGIVAKPVKLPKGGGSAELTFQFKNGEVQASKAYLETKYVKLSVAKTSGLGEILEGIELLEGLEGLNFSGVELVCDCVKKWRLSGSSDIVITVNLVPFGAAQHIKQ